MTKAEWDALSTQEKVDRVIEWTGLGSEPSGDGGYPDEFVIENGKIYIATCDHDGAPSLHALTLEEFLKTESDAIKDILEEDL
jgi:hypothetical protein